MSSGPPLARLDAPILEAEDARVAVDDAVAVDSLTVTTRGDRVVFLGDVSALFAALTGVPLAARRGAGPSVGPGALGRAADGADAVAPGEARIVAGSLRVAGHDVARGEQFGHVGAAPLDPLLPVDWTVEEYLRWSARLARSPERQARSLAAATLEQMHLAGLSRRTLRGLALPERRAVVLAQAIVTGPRVLVVEAPLADLHGAGATFVLDALARATEGRAAILSASRLDPGTAEGVLASTASHVLVLVAGALVLDGPPGEVFGGARVYALTVRQNPELLRAELASRGIDLRGGPLRFSASLPAGRTTLELFTAAAAARAPIVELLPLVDAP